MLAMDSTESNSPVTRSATRCSRPSTLPAGTTALVARSVSSISARIDAQRRERADEVSTKTLSSCTPMYCTLLTSWTRRNSSRAWSTKRRSSA